MELAAYLNTYLNGSSSGLSFIFLEGGGLPSILLNRCLSAFAMYVL